MTQEIKQYEVFWVDKARFQKHIGKIRIPEIEKVKEKLREMFVD